jgi:hypothetical protein
MALSQLTNKLPPRDEAYLCVYAYLLMFGKRSQFIGLYIYWLALSFYQGLKPSLLLTEKASGLFANPSLHGLWLHEEKFEPSSEACFL